MVAVSQLSPAAKAKIKAISGPRPRRYLFTLGTAWLGIALAISLAIISENTLVSLVAIYVVATRQNVLALLIHEQTHYLGFKSRYGDSVVNLLAGYPLLAVTVENYARVHLAHHRYYFTPLDPDFTRKQGPEWTFPMKKSKLFLLLIHDLFGASFLKYLLRKNSSPLVSTRSFQRKSPSPVWLRSAFYATGATVIHLTNGWSYFFFYWLVPLATIFPVIVRWSAICEHSYGHEGAAVDETSPVILPTLISRFFLPNLNFSMHVYHHYYPGVSFSALPEVHQIFVEENLVRQDQLFYGHLDYLRYVTTGSRAADVSLDCSTVKTAT
ncbi:fatty acid desaturase family protein [Novosphingobium sp. M1R2S20]|uniref:Fatty acid desaturase n=1 Tax=Novosphingobium rhizovicinum TaxID=3228928 RepID=A0ABV3RC65_9SPHN